MTYKLKNCGFKTITQKSSESVVSENNTKKASKNRSLLLRISVLALTMENALRFLALTVPESQPLSRV